MVQIAKGSFKLTTPEDKPISTKGKVVAASSKSFISRIFGAIGDALPW